MNKKVENGNWSQGKLKGKIQKYIGLKQVKKQKENENDSELNCW